MQAQTSGALDFVNTVDVEGRQDGLYVFANLRDAERFEAAVNHGSAVEHHPAFRSETPVNVGDAAERLIAAERGDVLEDMGFPAAAEAMREGRAMAKVLAALAPVDASLRGTRLVKGWADEDMDGGQS